MIGAWAGTRSAVAVPAEDEHLLTGAVTLHNHPRMTPELSLSDLSMAVKFGAPAVCLSWRTGLGRPLARQHLRCLTQEQALARIVERSILEDARVVVAEGAVP